MMICAKSDSLLRPEVSSIYWVIFGWLSSLGWTVISSASF